MCALPAMPATMVGIVPGVALEDQKLGRQLHVLHDRNQQAVVQRTPPGSIVRVSSARSSQSADAGGADRYSIGDSDVDRNLGNKME